jgi:hypothetical protein
VGLGVGLGLGLLGACTRVSDTERFEASETSLAIVQTAPVDGAQGVPRDGAIDLCFSHPVDPRSISPIDASVTSGESPIDVELTLQLLPWTGPGGAALGESAQDVAPWCAGSVLSIRPRVRLFAGLHYRLRFIPRARGWNGEILDTEADGWVPEGDLRRFYLEVTIEKTAEHEPDPDPDAGGGTDTAAPEGPTLRDLFASGQVFDPVRETCSCHRDPNDLALARLDLRDVDRAYAALVLDARPRETGFAMVSARRPSESFLVQKLLRDHDDAPLDGILGDAMPPDEPLPYADYVMIATWIASGAAK